jgi:hypothetical protein
MKRLAAAACQRQGGGRSVAVLERCTGEVGNPAISSGYHRQVEPEIRAAGGWTATFDQDGTLWVEHPIYKQVVYCPYGPALASADTEVGTFTQALYYDAKQYTWFVQHEEGLEAAVSIRRWP